MRQRKPLTAVESKNIISTVQSGKLSVIGYRAGYTSKKVGVIKILNEIVTGEVYLDVLKN